MTLFLYTPSRVGFSSPVDGGAGRFQVDRDGQMQRLSPLFRLGGRDAFTVNGHFAHALVIINGLCAQTSAQLPDMKYQLVRVLGEVLGLGWSQLNLNVITGSPYPTNSDKAGFPGMLFSPRVWVAKGCDCGCTPDCATALKRGSDKREEH